MKYFIFVVLVLIVAVSAEHLNPPPNQNEECKDGDTTSFDNCNNCFCSGGHWACTLKLCINQPVNFNQKVKRSAAGECVPGDVKMEACNKCHCTETGLWICTKIGCNKKREAIAAGFMI